MEYDEIFAEYSERTENRIRELKQEKERINKELLGACLYEQKIS
jgi:hypothetical protein